MFSAHKEEVYAMQKGTRGISLVFVFSSNSLFAIFPNTAAMIDGHVLSDAAIRPLVDQNHKSLPQPKIQTN